MITLVYEDEFAVRKESYFEIIDMALNWVNLQKNHIAKWSLYDNEGCLVENVINWKLYGKEF